MRVILFGLITFLVSCTPVADFASGGLNRTVGDEAALTFVTNVVPPACESAEDQGLCFDPASRPALDLLIRVRGDNLRVFREECTLEDDVRARCDLGDVDEPVFVRLAGSGVGATVTYRREGSNRLYQEIATHP